MVSDIVVDVDGASTNKATVHVRERCSVLTALVYPEMHVVPHSQSRGVETGGTRFAIGQAVKSKTAAQSIDQSNS